MKTYTLSNFIKVMFIFMVFISYSCVDNDIYFDIKSQCIISCNGYPITYLRIKSSELDERYVIKLKPQNKGKNKFSISCNDPCYTYLLMDSEIKADSFKLKPNRTYTIINHSSGDASACIIIVKTNSKSIVDYSNIVRYNK